MQPFIAEQISTLSPQRVFVRNGLTVEERVYRDWFDPEGCHFILAWVLSGHWATSTEPIISIRLSSKPSEMPLAAAHVAAEFDRVYGAAVCQTSEKERQERLADRCINQPKPIASPPNPTRDLLRSAVSQWGVSAMPEAKPVTHDEWQLLCDLAYDNPDLTAKMMAASPLALSVQLVNDTLELRDTGGVVWLRMRRPIGIHHPDVSHFLCLYKRALTVANPIPKTHDAETAAPSLGEPGQPSQVLMAGGKAASTHVPPLHLIPTEALVRLANRFELGVKRKGARAWNALSNNQEVLLDIDFAIDRIGHACLHLMKLRDKLLTRDWDGIRDDDDAGAVIFGGALLCCVTTALIRAEEDGNPGDCGPEDPAACSETTDPSFGHREASPDCTQVPKFPQSAPYGSRPDVGIAPLGYRLP